MSQSHNDDSAVNNRSGNEGNVSRASTRFTSVDVGVINAEALDVLEQSLMQQIKTRKASILAEREKKDAAILYNDDLKVDIIKKLDGVRISVSKMSEETRAVIVQRDEALQELRNVEQSFSDVHRKYEKAKLILENIRKNEEMLTHRDEELQLLMHARDTKLEAFKQEAQEIIEKLHSEYTTKLSNIDTDNAKLGAQFRRWEMRVETLEAELQQKRRENAQLNLLADELIGKATPGTK